MPVEWHGDELNALVNHRIEQGLLKAAFIVERRAKEIVPVDIGRLRASITHSPVNMQDLSIIVGTDVEYAIYVEMGTEKMAPRSYLRRALDESRNDIADIFGSI